ncbi:MarR family winged helix-turn-helix transcriptional regulator [Nonomuraea typhae]|uniref:MarR family winged helix-turn-helix transcriptional regulator n=1 Tax=Nonomuraea typhae TaxID=2603600 RepID=UPI0012FA1148|nr:MarR family winged helix-turn-helix transcriptional regulator [Nonomuraea typhae]
MRKASFLVPRAPGRSPPVHALRERGEVTVNEIAGELGLDQSGASRMVAQAAERGYLAVTASAADGRRRTVVLTEEGRELLAHAHAWQEEVFDRLTGDWAPGERERFHRAMLRLMRRSPELTSGEKVNPA